MAEKSNVEGVTITARGLQLIAKLTAAKMKMEFTSAKVGTGVLPDGANAYDLTHLVAYKMDGRIAGYGYDDDAKDAYVVMQISNEQIETGFVMTEAGIYAKDPDLGEILYGYLDLSEDPNYIMPAENGRFKTVQIKMHVIVGEVQEISATINPLSQVTREELQKELDKKVSIQGGDISDTVINIENPPDEDKNPVKYPEIGDSGTTKSIMGQIRRWLKSLKDDKVDKKGGDTADTVVSGLTDSTASFPQPTAGDSQKTLWGKVKKWQQDCITKFGNYVLTSMITNQHLNSTSNIPTSALVYLMQQAIQQNQNAINVLNTKLKMYISEDILIYTAMTVEAAIQAWFESEAMPNSICLRLINYNSGVAQVIAYKYSNYYGAVIYFGYGIDGIKLLKHTNGAWS